LVEVRRQDVEDLFRRKLKDFEIFLVCGSDAGLVSERCARIIKVLREQEPSGLEVKRIDGDSLAANEGALTDEAQALNLFGEKQLIWIRAGARNFTKGINALLEAGRIENRVVIEAGPLKADSALKKVCLRSPRTAVIECWPDSAKEVSSLIDAEFRDARINLSSAAKSLLLSVLGGDRLQSRSEIEKLVLFASGKGFLDAEELSEIVSDAGSWGFDDVIFAAFEGDRLAIVEKTQTALTHVDPTALLSMALFHCLTLLDATLEIEGGTNLAQAAERFPRLFGSRKSSIIKQLTCWTSENLLVQAQKLQDSVTQIRKDPRLQDEHVFRVFVSIAYSVPRAP
jgi:DNA polymerase III subunit delta